MDKPPTLNEVNVALEELEDAMGTTDSRYALSRMSELYAAAYSFKLHLMAKETQNAGHRTNK